MTRTQSLKLREALEALSRIEHDVAEVRRKLGTVAEGFGGDRQERFLDIPSVVRDELNALAEAGELHRLLDLSKAVAESPAQQHEPATFDDEIPF
jgi:hypothetical protein